MKPKSPLLATAFASLANAQSSATAIITLEASHDGAANDLTNTTLSIPLFTQYTNPALDAVSTFYLVGSNGDVTFPSITCYPFRNDDLTGMAGLPFTSDTPSRLSTNTVSVGSIMCNSTDTTAGQRGSVTSTLSATTTDLTRGSTNDVPNIDDLLPISTSSSSSNAKTTTSIPIITVTPTSTEDAVQKTATSVSVVTGESSGTVLSTMVSAQVSPSASSDSLNNGADATGAASGSWRLEGWLMVAGVMAVLMAAA